MLKYRLIFGPLMIGLLLGLFYVDNQLGQLDLRGTPWQKLFLGRPYLPAGLLMLAVFLLVIALGTRELAAIFRAKGIPTDAPMLGLSGTLGCLMIYIVPIGIDSQVAIALFATVMALLFLTALVRHSWRGRTQGAVAAGGSAMLAMIYLGVLPGFFILIRRWHSAWIILALILVTKCCDIGAYFTGRAIGRHKLIPWLSPGKTREGLVGGVVASTLAAVALGALLNQLGFAGHYAPGPDKPQFVAEHYPLWALAATGVLFGLVGQFGDLVASLLKRDAGLKDSGRSIPGFGGLLDVVDSPLTVAPVAYWLLLASTTTG